MSSADRERWNQRYQEGSYGQRLHPSPLVVAWLDRLTSWYPQGRVLDLACGRGRNAIFLAQAGFDVDAIDISDVGITHAQQRAEEAGASVKWRTADLDDAKLEPVAYDVIVVIRYLHRDRIPDLMEALRIGGTIVFEQHLLLSPSDPNPEPVSGPTSQRFRLRSNELLRLFLSFRILAYEEGVFTDADGSRMALSRLVATKIGS